MEAITSCEDWQMSLPKLRTTKNVQRRDSLSSSQTRDSGYNSDPDSLSPLDTVVLDQDLLSAPLSCVPSILVNNKATPSKSCVDFDRSRLFGRGSVTSDPAGAIACRTIPRSIPLAPELAIVDDRKAGKPLEVQPAEDIEKWISENLPSCNRPEQRVASISTLSSTSSCDMYTNTDISDDEQEHEQSTCTPQEPRSILKVIGLIIRRVEISLREAAYKQCAGNKSSNTDAGSNDFSVQNGRKASLSSGSKRKSRAEGTPPPEDRDEDGPNKKRRGSVTTTEESDTGARFACPFYKHEPDRYRNRRTCTGPGWLTVHRMKEHLYRSHAQSIYCPICYATFRSDKEQSSHVRMQQCQRSSPQQMEGIDRETVWMLRKRTTALRLEEDKWRDVYQVLFPDVSAADIPSPFYDCDSPSETSRRFRRELLRRVHEELLSEAGEMLSPAEQQLMQRVAQIIRRCEQDLLTQAQPPSTSNFNTARRPSDGSMDSSYQATPAPPFSPPAVQRGSTMGAPGLNQDDRLRVPVNPADHLPHVLEPTGGPQQAGWEGQSYDVFGTGIDWFGLFPPSQNMQYGDCDESLVAFSTPMYT